MLENNPPQVDPSTRAVINTNFDTTNIVSMKDSLPRILTTLKSCRNVLFNHCGPQSRYAMLINNMSAGTNFEPNIFTRDGIRILSSVEFLSPLERYIKELLTYVGQRVDNIAKDGTTTSMLFADLFLDKMLTAGEEIHENLSFFDINEIIDDVFDRIKKHLETYTFTVESTAGQPEIDEETKIKTAGIIAYMQALSSSGGNHELAIAMKEIFEKSPSISWDFITYHHSIKETGKAFNVEVAESDFKIRCITGQENICNIELNTEYLENNVKVIVFTTPINDMGFKTDSLKKYLQDLSNDTPVVIISNSISGSLLNLINDLNSVRSKKITYWQYASEYKNSGVAYNYELIVLGAIAGIQPFDMDDDHDDLDEKLHVFTAEKVHYHDTYMEFFGIVQGAVESNLHPYYAHPETATKFYAETRHNLEKQLALYKEGHKVDGRLSGLFSEMLNRLACIHRPQLRLGGPAHEQVANADVVQDVQGAIMSSLKHGFLINGPWSLRTAVVSAREEYLKSSTTKLGETIFNSIIDSLKEITDFLIKENKFDSELDDYFNHTPSADKYINILDRHQDLRDYYDFVAEVKAGDLENKKLLYTSYPVLQPAMMTTELLKRIKELIIKFIFTNQIIVYGAVMVNKDEE